MLACVSCGKGKSIQAIPIEDVEDTYFLDEIADSRSYVLLDDSSLDAIVEKGRARNEFLRIRSWCIERIAKRF